MVGYVHHTCPELVEAVGRSPTYILIPARPAWDAQITLHVSATALHCYATNPSKNDGLVAG
jgi:hypothetical protein